MPDSEFITAHRDEYRALFRLYLKVQDYFAYGKKPEDRKAMHEALEKTEEFYKKETGGKIHA